ncbi:hypothetical protein C0J52_16080 [Blattella germanica]|nr:hypothetical protein C0J52_16080 [Blattella germanica]
MIVGAHLVGASAATMANAVGVSKATVSNVMRACSMHGQTTSAKQNNGPSCPYLTELSFDHSFAFQTSFALALSMPS